MSEEQTCELERIVEKLRADGWKEQRMGTCYINGTLGTNLLKDGQVISMQLQLHPDEDFLEQEWGEEEA